MQKPQQFIGDELPELPDKPCQPNISFPKREFGKKISCKQVLSVSMVLQVTVAALCCQQRFSFLSFMHSRNEVKKYKEILVLEIWLLYLKVTVIGKMPLVSRVHLISMKKVGHINWL